MTLAKTAVQMAPPGTVAGATLAGRELAMQRRQAMARLGKPGAGRAVAGSTASAQMRPAVQRTAAVAAPKNAARTTQAAAVAAALASNPARARREALSRMGKTALNSGAQPQDVTRRVPGQQALAPGASASAIDETTTANTATLAMQAADVQAATASKFLGAVPETPSVRSTAASSGRALAQARRTVLAQQGKSGL
jgi:hypothetical protein